MLKTVIRQLILPPAGPLLLAACGFVLQRFRPRFGQLVVLASFALLLVLSLPVTSEGLTALTEKCAPLEVTKTTGAQAVVILGGGGQIDYAPEYGGSVARGILLERVTYGAYVARQTSLPILVTGNGIEALAMRATLARSFDVQVRWHEEKARDTFENAANSARLLLPEGVRKIILVTSGTHMWRSAREFAAAGFEVVAAPVSSLSTPGHRVRQYYIPQASALQESSQAIYELLGEPARRFLAFANLRRHPTSPAD